MSSRRRVDPREPASEESRDPFDDEFSSNGDGDPRDASEELRKAARAQIERTLAQARLEFGRGFDEFKSLVKLKLLRAQLKVRDLAFLLITAAIGGVVALVFVVAGALYLLRGISLGVNEWSDTTWAGDLAAGGVGLLTIFLGIALAKSLAVRASKKRIHSDFGEPKDLAKEDVA